MLIFIFLTVALVLFSVALLSKGYNNEERVGMLYAGAFFLAMAMLVPALVRLW
jgi:hypothetical protein